MRGPARGLQMHGATLSNVLSLNEPHLQRIIRRHVHADATVLDIGANTGFFTLMMARQTGSGGRVFAFEAIPSTAAILQRNLDHNGMTHVTAFPFAVSDREAELEFRIPRGGAPMASY